jgi:aryl-alcohol dehydrogenase-like predicted oxidoreductase
MFAWQFQKARSVAEKRGWANFVSMQNHLNLLYREEEREMVPYCQDAKVALTPYSPLAAGRLSRPWAEATKRFETDATARWKYGKTEEADKPIVERVQEIAAKRAVTMTEVSLGWLMQKPLLSAPVVGVTKLTHLEDAVKAVEVKLTAEEVEYLEEPYVPHAIIGPNLK